MARRSRPGHILLVRTMTLPETMLLEAERDAYKRIVDGLEQVEISLSDRLRRAENAIAVAKGYLSSGQLEAARMVLENLP